MLSCHEYTSNDVIFVFPHEGSHGRYLWANSELLCKVSPHFKTMFTSGMAESSHGMPEVEVVLKAWKQGFNAIVSRERSSISKTARILDDSDDEADGEDNEKRKSHAVDGFVSGNEEALGSRCVIIIDTSYLTYKVFFEWLLTGQVEFGDLRSAASDRRPGLSSPKSLYRLCHKLEIKELAQLSLEHYESQLSADNALPELFSDVSFTYAELKDVALNVVIKKWSEIKPAGGLDVLIEATEKAENDSVQVAKMAMEVLKRV